jgi:hypothetical protein
MTLPVNILPKQCCDFGEYGCQVPMPLNGRLQSVDFCIADIVAALNAANLSTVASCCGHGKQEAVISLADGRTLTLGNVVRFWDTLNQQKGKD